MCMRVNELESQRRALLEANARTEMERQWKNMLVDMEKDKGVWPLEWWKTNKEKVMPWLE